MHPNVRHVKYVCICIDDEHKQAGIMYMYMSMNVREVGARVHGTRRRLDSRGGEAHVLYPHVPFLEAVTMVGGA